MTLRAPRRALRFAPAAMKEPSPSRRRSSRSPSDAPAPAGLQAAQFHLRDEQFVVFVLPATPISTLTAAERAVAALVVGGASNADIARARSTSARTVANQVARIYRKLGVGSRAELAAALLEEPAPGASRHGQRGSR